VLVQEYALYLVPILVCAVLVVLFDLFHVLVVFFWIMLCVLYLQDRFLFYRFQFEKIQVVLIILKIQQ